MAKAISNTSPLLYLYRIQAIGLLPSLFDEIWVPQAVADEFSAGHQRGYDVPQLSDYPWLTIASPQSTPQQWFSLDLGPGEVAAMSLALENPDRIVLLDDRLARRTAQAAGLQVWGTLKLLLQAKSTGLILRIEPYVNGLAHSGMWMSEEIKRRILVLAGE